MRDFGTHLGIVASLALAGSLSSCKRAPQQGYRVVAQVTKGRLVFASSFYGDLEARKSIAIHTPDLSGVSHLTVETVLDDGTEVKQGDVVLTFEKGPIEDDLTEERAKLAVAKAQLRQVDGQLDMERIELELQVKRREMATQRAKLNLVVGVNLISKLDLERAKLDHQRAKLDLALARRALRSFAKKRRSALEVERLKVTAIEEKVAGFEQNLAKTALRAPASGVLYGPYTRLNWVRGKVAPGSVTRPGDKLLELPDLASFNAVLYVRQRDAALLKVGDRATAEATVQPGRSIGGKVVRKESFATTRNQRFGTEEPAGNLKEIKIVLELSDILPGLRPGGSVRADIASTLRERALLVPLAALREQGKGHRVTLESGAERAVKIGLSSTTHAEVRSGLSEGDRVLLGTPLAAPDAGK